MFNRSEKEIDDREEMKKTIDLFRPQIDQLKAERDAERVEKTKQLLLKLECLIQQREREIPGLQTATQQAREKEEQLRAEAQEALKVQTRTACELSLRTSWYDHQQDLLRSQVYELAPAVILERQRKWRDLINETRLKVETETRTTRRDIFGRASEIVGSNLSLIDRRIDVIGEAIKCAEEMKSHPAPESEIIAKLDALEKTFPPLTNDRETVTIPLPDVSELQRASW